MKATPPLEAVHYSDSPLVPDQPVVLYVHEHCLRQGVKCESKLCPIALALIQHFGTKDVMVLSCTIYVGSWHTFHMNGPLVNKLRDFDRGLHVDPYHFTLR